MKLWRQQAAHGRKRRALKILGHFLAHSAEGRADFTVAPQRGVNVRQDILGSHVLHKIGLMKQLRRLIARSTEQKGSAGLSQAIGEHLQRVEAGGSRAVIFRKRTITTAGNAFRLAVASASFSVVPNKNGP